MDAVNPTEPADAPEGRAQLALRWALLAVPFSLPFSIALAQVATGAALLAWAVDAIRRRDRTAARNPMLVPLLLFIAVAVYASARGWRPEISFPKMHRFLWFLLAFAIPAVRPRPGDGPFAFPLALAGALVAGTTLRSLYDLVAIPLALRHVPAGVAPSFWLYSQGDMRTPQFYMAALCFLMAGVRPAWTAGRRWTKTLATLLNAGGLVIHFKRGVWGAFAGAATILVAAGRRWRALAALAAVAAVLICLPPARERMATLLVDFAKQGSRMELWTKAAPRLIAKNPQGMGLAAMKNRDLYRYVRVIEPKLNHLHSNALQITVELGWAGLAVWLAWMTVVLRLLARAHRRLAARDPGGPGARLALGAFAAFCGLLINGLVEYNFGTGLILILFAVLMGIAVTLDRAAADGACA